MVLVYSLKTFGLIKSAGARISSNGTAGHLSQQKKKHWMGLVRIEMLPAPSSDIISGGQHFITLTAAHFCLFFFSYLFSILAEPDISCCFFLAHPSKKLLDAEWNIALRRVVDNCVYADSQPARK